jgi:SAM-dependent methyltransferase
MDIVSIEFDEKFWNERYRSAPAIWSGEPNPQLVAEISGIEPGAALDVGCGEGADAIWLAERGWRVTAIDISTVALDRAKALDVAPEVMRRIDWVHADLTASAPSVSSYDLASVHFMQLQKAPREALLQGVAASVKPNGVLLVVGHHPDDLKTPGLRRPPLPGMLYTAADIVPLLDPRDWSIETNEVRERQVEQGGAAFTVYDAVLRARRRT